MEQRRRVRHSALIDALEASPAEQFDGRVWRVVPGNRDPLFGSASFGRWGDGSFEVLYTSAEADGALAEMYFHLVRGQPVIPSKPEWRLYQLDVMLSRALRLADMASLDALDIDTSSYGSPDYGRRRDDQHRTTQEVAEAAHFLDFDGLIVPSARWDCHNVVLFTDRIAPEALRIAGQSGPVDWDAWKRKTDAA